MFKEIGLITRTKKDMKQQYVVGFMFSSNANHFSEVALIRKTKPKWQSGLLNGIGGKIEPNETEIQAIIREFKEETGYHQSVWNKFSVMEGDDWIVHCFVSEGNLSRLKTTTDEEVVLYDWTEIDGSVIDNLHMLIPMAHYWLTTKDRIKAIKIDYEP